jgi:hypothetical protein
MCGNGGCGFFLEDFDSFLFGVVWTSLWTISGLVPTIVDQNMNIHLRGSGTASIFKQAHQSVKWNCIAFELLPWPEICGDQKLVPGMNTFLQALHLPIMLQMISMFANFVFQACRWSVLAVVDLRPEAMECITGSGVGGWFVRLHM